MNWIWEQPEWPHFVWIKDKLNGLLRETIQIQGQLLGKAEAAGDDFSRQSTLDTVLHNIISSCAIEDEELNVESVRSSLARRLGLATGHSAQTTARTEGLADLILDATGNIKAPLSMDRLFQWHRLLFPPGSVLPSHALLEGGPDNFERGISASQYESVARVSKATATRHLADLVGKGFLEKKPGGGRSTRYHIPGRN
jgi:Fic family protein